MKYLKNTTILLYYIDSVLNYQGYSPATINLCKTSGTTPGQKFFRFDYRF